MIARSVFGRDEELAQRCERSQVNSFLPHPLQSKGGFKALPPKANS